MMLAAVGLAASLLAPCPAKPNCVSTLATDREHGIAPIRFTTTSKEAHARLLGILRAMLRTTIVASDDHVIRAEFRTAFFRFVDDGVFVIDDAAKTIHFRSASRAGYSDFGVNRKRMEGVRTAFAR
ncbi:MAG: DUF1499 domain-containing protein [Acidobacteriota bacterium]